HRGVDGATGGDHPSHRPSRGPVPDRPVVGGDGRRASVRTRLVVAGTVDVIHVHVAGVVEAEFPRRVGGRLYRRTPAGVVHVVRDHRNRFGLDAELSFRTIVHHGNEAGGGGDVT